AARLFFASLAHAALPAASNRCGQGGQRTEAVPGRGPRNAHCPVPELACKVLQARRAGDISMTAGRRARQSRRADLRTGSRTMKRSLPALSVAVLAAIAASAHAEPTDLGAGFSLSGNAAIVSDYRFRGYSQTNFRPAVQVGFDLAHSSGFYLGNWNSNVSDFVFPEGNLEMDFYGGWKGELGHGLGLDVGALYYYY